MIDAHAYHFQLIPFRYLSQYRGLNLVHGYVPHPGPPKGLIFGQEPTCTAMTIDSEDLTDLRESQKSFRRWTQAHRLRGVAGHPRDYGQYSIVC